MSLIGIIVFNFIFEARARYIMLYVPFFIIAGCIALKEIMKRSFLSDRLLPDSKN